MSILACYRKKELGIAVLFVMSLVIVLSAEAKRPQQEGYWIDLQASRTKINLGDTVRLEWTASDSPGTMIYDGRWVHYPGWVGKINAKTVQPSRSDSWRVTMYSIETGLAVAEDEVWIEVRQPRR